MALSLDSTEPDVPAIDIDDFGGAAITARHLLELGHRRSAVLAIGLGDDPRRVAPRKVRDAHFLNVRERARGYRTVLAGAGIPEEAVPVHAVRNDGSNVGQAFDLLFAHGAAKPTALLVMSDKVAMAAIGALAARGLQVPRDVSVVGFDGVPETTASKPPLATVEQPYRQIAEQAAAAILDDAMPRGRVVLPLTLVVRESAAPPVSG